MAAQVISPRGRRNCANGLPAQGIAPLGEAEYAFYDAPMVPGPLRRNEVLIPVAAQ